MTTDDKGEKKERVLHTRVSPSLDEELRERANKLGVSVSNLVRNVLLNAFEMVEDIVSDTGRVAKAAKGDRVSVADVVADAGSIARPIGWRELVLNVNAICESCNSILARGTTAAMAIFRKDGPDTFLCPSCLAALSEAKDES